MFAPASVAQHVGMSSAPQTRRVVLALTAALLAMLAGCAVRPPAAVPVTTPQRSARQLTRRRLDDPGLLRFLAAQTGLAQSPASAWTPARLSLAALYFHPDLRVDRAALQLAQADLRLARQLPNPRLDVGLKYGAAAGLAAPSPWTIGAAIGLLLLAQTQRQAQTQQAAAAVRAARLLLQDTAWRLRAQVEQAAVALWAVRGQVRLQRQTVRTALELQRRTAQRARAGLDSPLAAAQAQQAAQRAAMELAQARGSEQQAWAALAAAVGVPAAALRQVRLDLSAYAAPPPRVDPTPAQRLHALAQRTTVRAAWQQLLAAQAGLRLALAQRNGSPAQIAPGAERDQGVDRLTLGVRLPLPLFNQHQGQIAAARARLAGARAQLAQAQARALARIEQAEAGLRAAQRQAAQAARLLQAGRQQWAAAEAAQRAGLLGPLPVLRARLLALAAERAALAAHAQQWQAAVALQSALQAPLPAPSAAPPRTPHASPVVWRLASPPARPAAASASTKG